MVILWSLQFIVAKQALREIPPLALSGLRTTITSLCLLPVYYLAARRHAPRPWIARDILTLIVVATTGITLNQFFYSIALKYTSVGHSSLIMAVTPLVVLLIAVASRQERATVSKVLGMVVAFGGVAWLNLSHSEGGVASPLGDISALTCASLFAVSTVMGKNIMNQYGSIAVTLFCNGMAAVCLLPFTLFSGLRFSEVSPGAWWGVAYMGALAGAVGYLIYFYALAYLPSSRLSMYAYIQPILATLGAFLLLGESVTLSMLAAGALVLTGVWISGRGA
jgi:drug/metabolite transporter (DMT)-like permease